MHVYLRTPDGKRGRYLGFKGTDYVRDWQSGEKIGQNIPPHVGILSRLLRNWK